MVGIAEGRCGITPIKAVGILGNMVLMFLHIAEQEVNDYSDVNLPALLAAHDMFGYCHFTAIFH